MGVGPDARTLVGFRSFTQVHPEDITAVIGVVSGELVGNVLYGFPLSTARGIIDIMAGPDFELDSELSLYALGELAKMITGNAATELSSNDFICNIAPPVLI